MVTILSKSQAEQFFLCVASLLSQSAIWTFETARLLLFKITTSENAGHHHSLLYTFKDTFGNIHVITATTLNSTYIVPPPYNPHEKRQSSVFNSLAYHLQALFKVFAYHKGDKRQRRKICGRAGVSVVHVSDTTLVQWTFTHHLCFCCSRSPFK